MVVGALYVMWNGCAFNGIQFGFGWTPEFVKTGSRKIWCREDETWTNSATPRIWKVQVHNKRLTTKPSYEINYCNAVSAALQ